MVVERMRVFREALFFSLVLLLFSGMVHAGETVEKTGKKAPVSAVRPAASGLDADGAMHVGPEDRCPVCAMNVKKHEKFAAAIELKNGETHYFCGTGCMIRSWLHPEVFLGVDKSRLKRAVVKDYFTGKPLDAMEAYWVAGSDVVGPMGPALVPLKSESDREAFVKRHGGKVQFRMSEMTDEKWEKITGKKAASKPHGGKRK